MIWILLIIATIVNAIMTGFVLSTLWGWFVVPFGVEPIGKAWACGLSMLISLCARDVPPPDPNQSGTEKAVYIFTTSLIRCVLALIMGAIFHALMGAGR